METFATQHLEISVVADVGSRLCIAVWVSTSHVRNVLRRSVPG